MTLHPFIFLLMSMVIVVGAGCNRNTPPPGKSSGGADVVPVQLEPVAEALWDRSVPILGTLFPKDDATLSAQVEGAIEKTLVEFGDRVKEGQLLATIDTAAYEAHVQQAAGILARAEAARNLAVQHLERTRSLEKEKIIAASELEEAVSRETQAQADFKAAQGAVALANLNLQRSKVAAPFDAAVAQRIVTRGDFVRVGSELFEVVNDRVLKFIFHVPEKHAPEVVKELVVRFSVDALPNQTFTGKVYLISPSVQLSTRSFAVGALVPNEKGQLKANSFARGEVVLKANVPVLTVPIDAVLTTAGIARVFVAEGEVAKSRVVTLGRIREGRVEILSGLKKEERVIVNGQTRLRDGGSITTKRSGPPAATAPAQVK